LDQVQTPIGDHELPDQQVSPSDRSARASYLRLVRQEKPRVPFGYARQNVGLRSENPRYHNQLVSCPFRGL